MSHLMSPSIFDSTFSASIFARRTSNLSKSSIGEFGGLYQFEIRNGLALGLWISIHKNSRSGSERSDLILKAMTLQTYMATPPPPLHWSPLISV